MKKRPEKFNYEMIQDVVSHTIKDTQGLFLNKEFAIINGMGGNALFRHFLEKKVPLLIDDYRMGIVLKGDVHSNINLIDHHVTSGTILFLTPGSIVQPVSVEDDLQIMGLAVFCDLPWPRGARQQSLAAACATLCLK